MPPEDIDAFFRDPEGIEFVAQVLEGMAPKMAASTLVAQLVPEDGIGDVKFWVELGASIMLNKPIVAIMREGMDVPPKLLLVADEIVTIPADGLESEAGREALVDALDKISRQFE